MIEMATPKQLVECIAKVTGVSPTTVTTHDRNLAEAGLRTVGGRGLGPAKMSAHDAARLLIAAVASRNAKDSVVTVRNFAAQTRDLAADIENCMADGAPRDTYEFRLPSAGDATYTAGFSGRTVQLIAAILRPAP